VFSSLDNTLTRIMGQFYTLSLNLYPTDFRAHFRAEMQNVFTQAIESHAGTGNTYPSEWES